jgi:alkylated DNA repair dioxygenase AlkB
MNPGRAFAWKILILCSPRPLHLPPSKPTANLLPVDGTAHYYGRIVAVEEAQRYLEALLANIPWQHDEVFIFGKKIITARQVAWYGDTGCSYSYSGKTKQALPWTSDLRALKTIVECLIQASFNSCLLNLYQDGSQGMSWHSDDEKELGENPTIASLSLGGERRFCLKHKRTQETLSLVLENGSLLVMRDATQHHWLHSLPKTKKGHSPRINLTFRTILSV